MLINKISLLSFTLTWLLFLTKHNWNPLFPSSCSSSSFPFFLSIFGLPCIIHTWPLFPGTLVDFSFYNLNMEFCIIFFSSTFLVKKNVIHIIIWKRCVYECRQSCHRINKMHDLYVIFVFRRSWKMTYVCGYMPAVHPCSSLNTIETLKIAQPKAKWILNPFPFRFVVFLFFSYGGFSLATFSVHVGVVFAAMLIPCLPFAIHKNSFARHSASTHECGVCLCNVHACVLCLFE